MRRRRQNPEQLIQRAIVQHFRARGERDTVMFAIPNGGYRTAAEAGIMKATGTLAGVPDLCFIRDGKPFFLELKAEGGRPTEAQLSTIANLDKAGAFTAIAHGLDRAIAVLEQWGILKGRSG